MISTNQIRLLLEQGLHQRVIERVLQNGRSNDAAVRRRLLADDVMLAAARGLALQRGCELAWRAEPWLAEITDGLLELQRGDGGFAPRHIPGRSPVAATAVVLRGLLEYAHLEPGVSPRTGGNLGDAIARGLANLAARQECSGAIGDDAVDHAIVLWQLGGWAAFREAIHYGGFVGAVRRDTRIAGACAIQKLALAAAA